MRLSTMMFHTVREVPADAQMASHQLLLRAGMIRRVSAGIYSLAPMATRVLQRIAQVVREEMDGIGGQEVLLPIAQPASLWRESGRYGEVDDTLVRFRDRSGQEMVLAMTHEEAVTDLFRSAVQSYRQLPMMVYQVQTKFRDEARPRAGLVRLREFLMKDAYSFHLTDSSLDVTYNDVYDAYVRIFDRCGLAAIAVESDTGMMGGGSAHEFMFLSDAGEDTLIVCPHCQYAANREVAVAMRSKDKSDDNDSSTYQLVWFGNAGEIALVICLENERPNEVKVQRALGWPLIEALAHGDVTEMAGSGQVHRIRGLADIQVGVAARQTAERKAEQLGFRVDNWEEADIVEIVAGMACSVCKTELQEQRGIEVGNIFKLGTKYSVPMNAVVTDEEGLLKPVIMGCYGIGITRLLACIVEQNHDADGMIWPESVAPFAIHLVRLGEEADVCEAAKQIYEKLGPVNVLYDDRSLRPGAKLKDADLLGIPIRMTVSRRTAAAGIIEICVRSTGETYDIPLADVERHTNHL